MIGAGPVNDMILIFYFMDTLATSGALRRPAVRNAGEAAVCSIEGTP